MSLSKNYNTFCGLPANNFIRIVTLYHIQGFNKSKARFFHQLHFKHLNILSLQFLSGRGNIKAASGKVVFL